MNTQINPTTGVRVEVFGPMVEFLTSPGEAHNDFCVMRGVIPPGVSVPLHSHPDTEDFIVLSGEVEALRSGPRGYEWVAVKAGDYVHVPSNARHAWRNVGAEPNVALMVTTPKLGRFFQEVGRPVTEAPQPVTPEELTHFLTVATAYGYWNATPEENAAVGIRFQYLAVSDLTFACLRAKFSPREVVELLLIVGHFRMIGSLMTTLEVELDPAWAAQALDRARAAVVVA